MGSVQQEVNNCLWAKSLLELVWGIFPETQVIDANCSLNGIKAVFFDAVITTAYSSILAEHHTNYLATAYQPPDHHSNHLAITQNTIAST